jgi:predicted ribosomally synthesized peptide with SipW-like signal peptide
MFIAAALLAALAAGYTAAWFTDEAAVSETKFTAGTVDIEADRIISDPGTGQTYSMIPYIVLERDQKELRGPRYDGERPNDKIYEYISSGEWGSNKPGNPKDFYTLGIHGYLILELSEPMLAGTGTREIKIITGGYEEDDCDCDMAEVYVSDDKVTWHKVGGTLTGPVNKSVTIAIPDTVEFDFDINYIKIQDISPEAICVEKDPNEEIHNGYDLFYIECGIRNGAGGWKPGDSSYIDYKISNTGTKNIRLRVKLTGVWQTYDPCSQTWQDTGYPNTNVSISPAGPDAANWILWSPAQETPGITYYVYNEILPGSVNGQTPGSAELRLMVTLLSGTDPGYQGCRFVLMPEFEAIQASHSYGVDDDSGWTWDNYHIYN